MTKESTLEHDCKKLAELFGWVSFKGSGRYGAADQIFLRDHIGFVVEFKRPGGKQRKNQKTEQQLMKKAGVPYYLVDTFEKFVDVLKTENDRKVVE